FLYLYIFFLINGVDKETSLQYIRFSYPLNEMLYLFQQTVTGKSSVTANGYGSSDEGDDEDEDDSFDVSESQLTKMNSIQGRNGSITEEEKERRRAEKRRAKKKRRREKKKLEKLEQQPNENDNILPNKARDCSDNKSERKPKNSDKVFGLDITDDEADFDPSSAFFTNIVNKKKMNLNLSEQSQLSSKDRSKDRSTLQSHSAKSEEEASNHIEECDTVILRSRKLAIRGNEMAQMGHYAAAIDLFTEAIRLYPSDFRFFGNRSYCYERIQQYDKALKDAEKSISICSNWPKGYFRKGQALAGQKQFCKAEEAFLQVVRLDKNCEDARQELLKVRTHQITEMGFTKLQAEAAILQYGTVQRALDSLLTGIVADNLNIGFGSDKEFSTVSSVNHNITINNSSCSSPSHTTKMDPTNPDGLTALWVGNVLPEVSEKKLNQIFSRYGPLSSVRCLPDRFCAFINYKSKESASTAMNSLQGVECGGQKLLIKFPDNPVINVGNVTILKSSTSNNGKRFRYNLPKQSGPVNGNECYFWRTTGCQFGDKCHYRHCPDHKGIDLKPWHKVK
ncbi:protein STIP1 homolog isoform X1, partial [Argonauta hians]